MRGTVDQSQRRVEVRIREQMPRGAYDRPESIIERLDQLESDGKINEYTVDVWGRSINTSPSCSVTTAMGNLDTVREFQSWAAENGMTLEPAFQENELSPLEMNETYEVLVLPVVCLAVYEDDSLKGVFPCARDDVFTVDDCIEALREGSDWFDRFEGFRMPSEQLSE
ncbi:HTH domain-containing protein [Halogeometricum borinquense]|uniref:HTH domain-containing protein n=1 Tax=Halogeometricum borinquense TaxID=60847 RepID=UPI001F4C85EF|nr:HTH domain-containing protein [Halogeometricum borinquense]